MDSSCSMAKVGRLMKTVLIVDLGLVGRLGLEINPIIGEDFQDESARIFQKS